MPSGYTHPIKDGISFEKFAMSCARAFGACSTMRDDPSDAEIPESFKPSTYDSERAKEVRKRIAEVEMMSLEQLDREAESDYNDTITQHQKAIQEKLELKEKYEVMLAKVEAWVPPSKDHEGLKEFMLRQIRESISFDCGESYSMSVIANLERKTGAQWKEQMLAELKASEQSANQYQIKENERTEKRNLWIKQLRESLNQSTTN